MTELPTALKRDLAALRRRAGPPAGVEDRVLAAVESLGLEPDPDGGGDLDPEPELDPTLEPKLDPGAGPQLPSTGAGHGQLVWWGKIVAATLALTGTGLLVVRTAAVAMREPSEAPVVAAPRDVASTPAAVEPPRTDTSAPQDSTGTIASPPTITSPDRPAGALTRTTTDAPNHDGSTNADTLAEELALLDAARSAADAQAALTHLQAHAQRFASGVLAAERELLMIERLCELGRLDQARVHDRAYLQQHGDSPKRAAIAQRCPTLARQ